MQVTNSSFINSQIKQNKNINKQQNVQSPVADELVRLKPLPAITFKAYSLSKLSFSGNSKELVPPKLYSIVFQTNPALKKIHESVLRKCSKEGWTKDSPELAEWLYNRLENEHRLWWTTNLNPRAKEYENENFVIKASKEENCNYAKALTIYACGIMERQFNRDILKVAPSNRKGKTDKYGEVLEILSNIYRAQYKLHLDRPHYLEVAHDLSKLAGDAYRFGGDKPTYRQSNSHREHLSANTLLEIDESRFNSLDNQNNDYFKEMKEDLNYTEEVLKLCLAFNQIEAGPHNTYAPALLKDLVTLYKVKGEKENEKLYSDYSKKVVPIKQEPELWYKEHYEH